MLTKEREKEIRKNWDQTGTECGELLTEIDRLREALRRIKSHGCCVMHSDRGCPGCIAHEALDEEPK